MKIEDTKVLRRMGRNHIELGYAFNELALMHEREKTEKEDELINKINVILKEIKDDLSEVKKWEC